MRNVVITVYLSPVIDDCEFADSSSAHRKEKSEFSLSSAIWKRPMRPRRRPGNFRPASVRPEIHGRHIPPSTDPVKEGLGHPSPVLHASASKNTETDEQQSRIHRSFSPLREMALLLHDLVGFSDVPFFEILVVAEAYSTFVACGHFLRVILESSEVRKRTVPEDDASAYEADLRISPDDAFKHVASCDLALPWGP